MGKPVGPVSAHDVSEPARQIEVRQVEVRKRAFEKQPHADSQSMLHADKKVLEGLEDIPVDDLVKGG